MAVARMMALCHGLLVAMEFRGREWGDGRRAAARVRAEGEKRKSRGNRESERERLISGFGNL